MMGGFAGVWQWVIVLVIVLILFGGRGKIARLMGDVGKGISSFKRGLKSDAEKGEEAESDAERPALKAEAVKPAAEQPQPAEEATRQRKAAEG